MPLEGAIRRLIGEVDAAGGAVAAVESGLVQRAVEEAAYRQARRIESGEAVVVGVNRFTDAGDAATPGLVVDPGLERDQVARLAAWRTGRSTPAVDAALGGVRTAAAGDDNLLPPMKVALLAGATVGEVSDALADVFGRYRPSA